MESEMGSSEAATSVPSDSLVVACYFIEYCKLLTSCYHRVKGESTKDLHTTTFPSIDPNHSRASPCVPIHT